jgi:hypothetical protein
MVKGPEPEPELVPVKIGTVLDGTALPEVGVRLKLMPEVTETLLQLISAAFVEVTKTFTGLLLHALPDPEQVTVTVCSAGPAVTPFRLMRTAVPVGNETDPVAASMRTDAVDVASTRFAVSTGDGEMPTPTVCACAIAGVSNSVRIAYNTYRTRTAHSPLSAVEKFDGTRPGVATNKEGGASKLP